MYSVTQKVSFPIYLSSSVYMKCLVIGMIACMEIIIFRRVFFTKIVSFSRSTLDSLFPCSLHLLDIVLAAYNVFSCLCQLIFLKYVLEWSGVALVCFKRMIMMMLLANLLTLDKVTDALCLYFRVIMKRIQKVFLQIKFSIQSFSLPHTYNASSLPFICWVNLHTYFLYSSWSDKQASWNDTNKYVR